MDIWNILMNRMTLVDYVTDSNSSVLVREK